jgi:tetraacyldisaccharide 4'-kinase
VKPCLEVVLLTERDLKWPRWLLPAGRLREPLSSLKRAGAVILTKRTSTSSPLRSPHRVPEEKIFRGDVRIHSFLSVPDNIVAGHPSGKRFFAFCGIGHPEHFLNSLLVFGTVEAKRIFADHHRYSLSDVREIMTEFDMMPHPDKVLITTEKDFVRLAVLPGFYEILGKHTLWVAQSEFVFENVADEERFIQLVYDTCSLKRIR